jgi:hypothetical protein
MSIITIGALIDKTIDHYHHHIKELVGVSLWVIVGAAPFLFSGYIAPGGIDTTTPSYEAFTYLILNTLGLVTTTITSLWISANLVLTIHARKQGETPDHVALGKKAWKFVPILFCYSILLTGALFAVSILAFIPGLIVMLLNVGDGTNAAILGVVGILLIFAGGIGALYLIIRYAVEIAFTQYILILEHAPKCSFATIRNAVQSSRAMVKGSWFAVVIRLFIPNAIISLLVTVIAIGVSFSTSIFIALATASLSALAVKLIAVIITLSVFVINAVTLPLYSLVTYYLYDSVKRKQS